MAEQDENSIIEEEDGPDFTDEDIEEASHAKLQKFQRIRASRLIPRELLVAFIAGFIVLMAVVGWTMYNKNEEIVSDYDEQPLWSMSFYTNIREQRDFNQIDKKMRAQAKALEKTGGQPLADAYANLGMLYMRNGRWQQALDCLQKWKKFHTDQASPETAQNFYNLALTMYHLGDEVDAEGVFKECLDTAHKAGFDDYPAMLPACQGLLAIYTKRGDLPDAQEAAQSILRIFKRPEASAIKQAERNFWLCQVADTERKVRDYKQAESLYKRALDGGLRGEQSDDTAKALFGLSLCLLKQHKFQEAERYLKQAHLLGQATLGPQDRILTAIRQEYAECLWKTNWIAAVALKFSAENNKPAPPPER